MTTGREPAGTWRGRLGARCLAAASWAACHLPERLAIRLAELGGDLWYRLAPAKRRLARGNLERVVTWMASEQAGDSAAWPAATDPKELERLVRSAFRHYARNYLETMRAPTMGGSYVTERTTIEDPAVVDAAFAEKGPVIFIGLHFGSLELPGFYLVERSGRPVTTPMETIDEPAIQAWFVRTRNVVGIRLVELKVARSELAGALERGEIAGLVADRDITGGGVEVSLFGSPAPIPAGPGLLAVQSRVPAFVAGAWRTTPGRYRGRLERIDVPTGGSRREQVTAFLAAEVAAFERLIAKAPDQW
ncbi:MAG: lysophospholipid acyltransferase family protein, partial [Candidatus Limnocylindrales bacterium]